jgi:hypothetical protein
VRGTNDAPVAFDDAQSFNEDASIRIAVLDNDRIRDGDALTLSNPQIVSIRDQNGNSVAAPYGAFINEGGILLSDPSSFFQNLAAGDIRTVTVNYTVSDGQASDIGTATHD